MMEKNRRFTILTFPQHFDGNILKVNILFLPRNQNPLNAAIELNAAIPDAPAFADAGLQFEAKIINSLDDFPMNVKVTDTLPLVISNPVAGNARSLFEALANSFQITNLNTSNADLTFSSDKAPDARKKEDVLKSVRKYLPLTYRESFNFISPRTKNAVTDDSYHCAMRDAKKKPGFIMSSDSVSWGKVFAYALRQPQLAQELGMIYKTELTIDPSFYPKGGWLYIDLAANSDYKLHQNTDDTFIKKYAARIPVLETGKDRSVFAAIQFPVLFKKPGDLVDPVPEGNFDELFIEAASYDDGFAKIVHAFQPVSQNLLAEKTDGFHPTKESGIRLGWDDEQILIWYMRQMMEDASIGSGKRIDSPSGVFGYKIDVREKESDPWESLNEVSNKIPLSINGNNIQDFNGELLYQVYPAQLDGDKDKCFWLPMYFANWSGKSMVLPDDEAISIYQNESAVADPANAPNNDSGTGVTGPAQNNLSRTYSQTAINTKLRYGKNYLFRVRLSDLTSGGPSKDLDPVNESQSSVVSCQFKRYVSPNTVRIKDVPVNNDESVFEENELKIQRPLLGYPSVVFTDKYADPITLLKQASADMLGVEAFGISDPDVESVEITVEVQALKMDNLKSVSGKENYIKFYTTVRKFPAGFDDELVIPIEFRDINVLSFNDLSSLGVNQTELDALPQLILPTSRSIRLTVRAVCDKKNDYYGLENESNHELDTRYGRTRYVMLYKPSENEENLFTGKTPGEMIRGIYLQPDPPAPANDLNIITMFVGKTVDKIPDMIQRLAQQLKLENNGLTLVGKKGERIQFGCSNRIRHTLAPDNSSITFASKGDLMNHWLCCLTLEINRDWTWDALKDRSFIITRKKRFNKDNPLTETETLEIGDIEIKKTISIDALQKPNRSRTTLVFIDAVEPKNLFKQPAPNNNEPRFPDLIELEYSIETKFKTGHALIKKDDPLTLTLELPVTINPAQIPKIASAGIALSPYERNEKYSATEPRSRYLWIEFEEPVKDPNDTYFARVLAYSPDQLISNNNPELLKPPDEPSLPVDPEYIRIVTPEQPDDEAGINAMQPMEKASDSDVHYLLPIPPGLYEESDELFGFFTYEFRLGHSKVWSTAQGRFGRALRATGIQHPAPILTSTVNRDEEKLYVTAPYAVAVHKGKNVTADPPRTELWALLYAQVRQADNKDFRNILLFEKKLDWRVKIEHDKKINPSLKYSIKERSKLKYINVKNWKDELEYGKFKGVYQLADTEFVNKDATKYGTVIWSNSEVNQMLELYGLPLDSPLSILCVEILPVIKNVFEHVSGLDNRDTNDKFKININAEGTPGTGRAKEYYSAKEQTDLISEGPRPLSDDLGNYRILRTSPLVEVPFVCCT